MVEAGRGPGPVAGRRLGRLPRRAARLRWCHPGPAASPAGDPAGTGRRRWRLRDITLTAALVLLLAGLLTGVSGGVVGYLAASRITPALLDPDSSLSEVSPPVNRPPGSIADIAQRVLPVVVSIEVRSSAGSGTGSGVVIDGGGYVLTNNHVISQVATGDGQLRVRFDDESVEPARVVGRDPKTDLAVLKVEKPGLTVATLGDSGSLAVGDPVIAVGSRSAWPARSPPASSAPWTGRSASAARATTPAATPTR